MREHESGEQARGVGLRQFFSVLQHSVGRQGARYCYGEPRRPVEPRADSFQLLSQLRE